MSTNLLLIQAWADPLLYLTIVRISSIGTIGVRISCIAKAPISIASIAKTSIAISSIKQSRVSLSLSFPLDKRVGDNGAGANSEGSSIGVLLLEKSRGGEKAGNLMDSSDKISIVTSLSLVSSNSNWDWEVGGGHVSLQLQRLDSICEGRSNSSSIWVSIDTSTIDTGTIDTSTIDTGTIDTGTIDTSIRKTSNNGHQHTEDQHILHKEEQD